MATPLASWDPLSLPILQDIFNREEATVDEHSGNRNWDRVSDREDEDVLEMDGGAQQCECT